MKPKRAIQAGLTCRHPDRDFPKLMCGYLLPCPYHTVIIDLGATPPTVNIPITSRAIYQRERLGEIALVLSQEV